MTSINRIDRALTTLRQVLSERAAALKTASPATQNTGAASQAARSDRTRQVRRRIKERLAALDLSQAADQERGTAIFLETVLANEFGTELLADPGFYNLMADVKSAMLADPDTQRDLVSMLVELKDSD